MPHIMPQILKSPRKPCHSTSDHLYLVQDSLLELTLDLLARVVLVGLTVETEKSTEVELGRLEELDLAHVDLRCVSRVPVLLFTVCTYVLQRVDALGGLLNLASNDLGDELLGELGECARAGVACHDLNHLLADRPDLRRGSVCGLLDLVWSSLGEGDGEEAQEVVVGGLDHDVGLDEGLPLADERAQLVRGEVEAVEVGQAVLALDLVDAELDLAESVVLILLQVGERDLEYPALQVVVCVLETGGAVDEGLADAARHTESVHWRWPPCGESYSRTAKVPGALTLYQSFFAKVSVFFLRPFLPFESLLFLPTAMIATLCVSRS
jgi:hypothetical protein